jgi:hypothetical protein
MAEHDVERLRSRDALKDYAGRSIEDTSQMPGMGHGQHGPAGKSVRQMSYKGHQLVVRTSYEFEVDGKPVRVELDLDNDGNVTCHALPNYSFTSAVLLLRKLVDQFPDSF